jgi:hypothetical protein
LPLLKICGHTGEGKSCQNVGLDFAFRTIQNEEKQKNCSEERNGESDRRGDGSSSFIVKKAPARRNHGGMHCLPRIGNLSLENKKEGKIYIFLFVEKRVYERIIVEIIALISARCIALVASL